MQLLFSNGTKTPFFETEQDIEYCEIYDEKDDIFETYSIDTRKIITKIVVEEEASGGIKDVYF